MRHPARLIPASLAAALVLPCAEAAAQMMRGPMRPQQQQEGARPPPPPALPGLQGRRSPAPIPADPNVSLGPNEALFDAINRGDLPAAREAVGRGADVGARNVLGLTPIDSAVDQGRTEIMFYLLSVRGSARAGSAGPAPEVTAAAAPPPARVASRGARGGAPEATGAAGARDRAPAAPSGPRLWAGDGGAPIPSVGFLGFDVGRPAGGGPAQAESRAPPPPQRGRGRG